MIVSGPVEIFDSWWPWNCFDHCMVNNHMNVKLTVAADHPFLLHGLCCFGLFGLFECVADMVHECSSWLLVIGVWTQDLNQIPRLKMCVSAAKDISQNRQVIAWSNSGNEDQQQQQWFLWKGFIIAPPNWSLMCLISRPVPRVFWIVVKACLPVSLVTLISYSVVSAEHRLGDGSEFLTWLCDWWVQPRQPQWLLLSKEKHNKN